MQINSKEDYDSEWIKSELQSMDKNSRRKNYAVAILSQVWSGGSLPPPVVEQAMLIRDEMTADGTWASA